eukprot:1183761-Prorocentrum_minimum.AAC.1
MRAPAPPAGGHRRDDLRQPRAHRADVAVHLPGRLLGQRRLHQRGGSRGLAARSGPRARPPALPRLALVNRAPALVNRAPVLVNRPPVPVNRPPVPVNRPPVPVNRPPVPVNRPPVPVNRPPVPVNRPRPSGPTE